MEASDSVKDKEKGVLEKLRVFVKVFVYLYEKSLTKYYERLQTKASKPGKFADSLNKILGVGKGFSLDISGLKTPVGEIITFPLLHAISKLGNMKNREELNKLLGPMYEFKHHPDRVRDALVEAGIEIFQCFEMQFVQLTSHDSWERAMDKLAIDAVNRVLSFSKENFRGEDLIASFLTKGIVEGKSKESFSLSHILKAGRTVVSENSDSLNTAELFDNVGLVVIDDNKNAYYRKKDFKKNGSIDLTFPDRAKSLKKLGYRRLFVWESKEHAAITKNYAETTDKVVYQYILMQDTAGKLKEQILTKIEEDPKHLEEKIPKHLNAAIKQIEKNSLIYLENLESLIAGNQNILYEIRQGDEEIKQTVVAVGDRIIETVGRNERTNQLILFDVKEALPQFTGREEELQRLHKMLQNSDEKNIPRIAAITGLGGIGKSELAKKYVSLHLEEYDSNVIWINAETDATLRESFCTLAKDKLKLPTTDDKGNERKTENIVDDVYDQFLKKKKSLFIFDNAERTVGDKKEGTQAIEKFLPRRLNKPYVIITSRHKEWELISSIILDVLSNEEAKELIEKALEGVVKLEENESKRLAKELGNLPLALRQAVAFIKMQNNKLKRRVLGTFTISAYLKELKENAEKLLSHEQSIYAEYPKTVMNTWQVTINKIETEEGTIGKLAFYVLQIMAYLAPDDIKIDEIFMTLIDDEEDRYSAVELLHQYSLVNLESGSVSIHRLVQTATRLHLEELHENEKVIEQVFHRLGFNRKPPKKFGFSSSPHKEIFISHLDYWIKKETTKKDVIEKKYLVRCLEVVAYEIILNDTCKAYEMLDRALTIFEKQFGTESLEFAKKLEEVSINYRYCGEKKKAMELLDRALPIFEKLFGTESLEFAKKLEEVRINYRYYGDEKKAMELLDRALPIFEKLFGNESLEFAKKLEEVINGVREIRDHKKATELLDRALPIFEKQFGTESLGFAEKLTVVSRNYRFFENEKKAMELLDRALPIFEKLLGTESWEFAKKLEEVSINYRYCGDEKKAMELLDRALSILEKQFGTESLEFAKKLEEVSINYRYCGEKKKAMELLDRALPIFEKQFGTESLKFAKKLEEVSMNYRRCGDEKKAMELLDRALSILEKQCGTESLDFAKTLEEVIDDYRNMVDDKKAMELLDRALPIFEKQFGTESLKFAKKLEEVSMNYRRCGDKKKAMELLDRALPIFEKQFGTESLGFAEKLTVVSRNYRFFENEKKAMELLDRALPIFEKLLGTESWEFAKKLEEVSINYHYCGDDKKAMELLDRALPIFEKQFGTESLEFAKKLEELSNNYLYCHDENRDEKKAMELLDRALPIFEKHFGTESWKFAKKLEELSRKYRYCHDENRDEKKAMELRDRALPIFEKHFGTESWEFAKKLSDMSSLCCHLGEHKRTVEFLGRALLIYEKKSGSQHLEVALTLFSLGKSYSHLDSNKEEEFFDRAVLVFKNLKLSSFQQSPWPLYEFHKSVKLGSLTWIKKLIEHGFNVLQRNYRDTVLHQAVDGNKEEVVKLILDEIKEKYPEKLTEAINAKDSMGNTPLMRAAQNGRTNSAKILLGFGPDLNTRNKMGMTALHWAVKGGHHEVLKLLLDYKADYSAKEIYVRTPLDLAKEKLMDKPEDDNLQKIIGFFVDVTGSQ